MSTICWNGPGHLPLLRYRVAKHRDTYARHLLDVLLHQDAETAPLLRRNDHLERYIGSQLEPAVNLRRLELARVQARLAAAAPVAETSSTPEIAAHAGALEAALQSTAAEVTALRASMSWRVTAPLRTIYGWWLRSRAAR